MTHTYRPIFFALILLLTPLCSHAALSQYDWKTPGDNSIIFDNATNVEWLSLSQTVGETYDYISSQLVAGGEYEGFRFATLEEVKTLIINAGSSWGTCYSCPAEIPHMEYLITLIGSGYSYGSGLSTWGYVLSDDSSPFFNGVMLSVDYNVSKKSALTSGGFKNSNLYPNLGGFLIRPVPIPGAIWLFISSLLSFAGFRLGKKFSKSNSS
jgi:hypothetical protein